MTAPYQPQFDQNGTTLASVPEFAEGAAGAAASFEWPASPGIRHCLGGIYWSYDDAPTGGMLTIEDGNDVVFEIDIPTEGAGFIPFNPPRAYTAGNSLTVTLAGGGGTVVGKINVNHWWQLEDAGLVGVTPTTTTTTTSTTTTT